MEHRYEKLILPKGYLSWSQIYCWLGNRARYISEYFEDGKRLDTRYLRFGSQFSHMVEELCKIMGRGVSRADAIKELGKDYPIDESMENVLLELEIDGISEYQIGNSGKKDDLCPVVKVRGVVPILCFLDKYVGKNIREYKTGLAPWTLVKVQKHDQLTMYGVGLKWSGHPLPEYADLDWIETKETEKEKVDFWRDGEKVISATGRIKSFHREFDPREFARMEDLIERVAWDISDAYQDHLTDL